MVSFESSEKYSVYDLARLIKILRSPEGCPWDREQTHGSIRRNFIEEAYEAAEAIDEGDMLHLREELGDVLVQVIFHADIEEDAGGFTLDDVADAAVRKLLYRHPHVFGDVAVSGSQEVLRNWDELKRAERGEETASETLMSVAKSLPALWRAEKVQSKASKVGFDWEEITGALDKLREEVSELAEAVRQGDRSGSANELGDVLFAAVNAARFLDVDPEEALGGSTGRFIARFAKMEELITAAGLTVEGMEPSALDEWYNKAKSML